MPKRKLKRVVKIGNIAIGGNHPIAVQTMLNVPVKDIAGNVAQAKRVAEAGCPIDRVKVTAPDGEEASVRNITVRPERIDRLLELLQRNQVPPVALRDVIDDWL